MAWRRHHRYYYRSERQGNQVRSVYMGCGLIAETSAQYESLRRVERRSEAMTARET